MSSDSGTIRRIGRYTLHERIAAGGMGAVYLGLVHGEAGFSRTVAIKCMHANATADPNFVSMFIDEARLAARVRHPNVLQTLDVAYETGNLILVMEYIHGESVGRLAWPRGKTEDPPIPLPVAIAIGIGALQGLHAAHEATDTDGKPLGIVHRDVSPPNIIVGADGVTRVLDFGVAKAAHRLQTTGEGFLKGKIAYMCPEQLHGKDVDRRADIFALGVVLWEIFSGQRLFRGEHGAVVTKILLEPVTPLRQVAPHVPREIEAIVMKSLAHDRDERWATARDMARALEQTKLGATTSEVAEVVAERARKALAARTDLVKRIEKAGAMAEDSVNKLISEIASSPKVNASSAANAEEETSVDHALAATPARTEVSMFFSRKALLPTIAVLGLIATIAILGLSFVLGRMVGDETTSSTSPTPVPPPEASSVPPLAASSAPPPASSPSVATSAPTPSGTTPRKKQPPPPPPAPKASGHRTKPDCTDPYTRDEHGVRIYRRECLE